VRTGRKSIQQLILMEGKDQIWHYLANPLRTTYIFISQTEIFCLIDKEGHDGFVWLKPLFKNFHFDKIHIPIGEFSSNRLQPYRPFIEIPSPQSEYCYLVVSRSLTSNRRQVSKQQAACPSLLQIRHKTQDSRIKHLDETQ